MRRRILIQLTTLGLMMTAIAVPALDTPNDDTPAPPTNWRMRGWQMMTPAERDAHHEQMANAKTFEQQRQLMAEHRAQMTERMNDTANPMGPNLPGMWP